MGCIQSKNHVKHVLTMCKKRKKFMMKAIASWNAFATAFSAYSSALKNVGAALSDYSQGIIECIHHQLKKPSSIYLGETPTMTTPQFMCSPILENRDEEIDEETFSAVEEAETTPLVDGHKKQLLQNQGDVLLPGRSNYKVLAEITNELDRHFLEESECVNQLKAMFQTQVDTGIDFADQVIRAISWNGSFGGRMLDDTEVHDGILGWEKQLYKELKAFGSLEVQYQSSLASLNMIQKRRSVKAKAKARAEVVHFHSMCDVSRESIDSGILQIARLRDELLYERLVKLIDEMAKMWDSMCVHHDNQFQIVTERLKGTLDAILGPILVSEDQQKRTVLLWKSLRDWNLQYEALVRHQKEYIDALGGWLGLNLENIDSCLEETARSTTPICGLIEAWKNELGRVRFEVGSRAINSFSEAVILIMLRQEAEIKHRKKCEEKQEKVHLNSSKRDKLENELESYQKINEILREMLQRSLTTDLENLFRGMSESCLAYSQMYEKLRRT